MQQNTINRLDVAISRLLFVTPQATAVVEAETADSGQKSESLMGYSLAFSAVRCILQYVLLPFVLPFIGVAASWALGLTMVINIVAIIALVTSLRRMWQIQYEHRWRYLALAGPAFLILVSFFTLDIIQLVNG